MEGFDYIVMRDVMVPMRDSVRLAGDLHLPATKGILGKDAKFPCVLIRTPYNKDSEHEEIRGPGNHWTAQGYACFIQDVRGRFKSEGKFYKYINEAEDGYDTVEWLAAQVWCNGSVCTTGPSYLCHVQTSMALLRPPHLTAMFCDKGGFWNSHSSGIRQGGAYEARQWVWAVKKCEVQDTEWSADARERVNADLPGWLKRYPFKKGSSPLSAFPEYENFIFDQVCNTDYDDYWKQKGLNTEEYVDEFADVPVMFLGGWYDIYAKSTVNFFRNLQTRLKSPVLMVMGPWEHTSKEGHTAGEVDFGVEASLSNMLGADKYTMERNFFNRFATAPTALHKAPKPTPVNSQQSELIYGPHEMEEKASEDTVFTYQTSGKRYLPPAQYHKSKAASKFVSAADTPLPPRVRYFVMGGGDGRKTRAGKLMHGGVWKQASQWPPEEIKDFAFYLGCGAIKLDYEELVKTDDPDNRASGVQSNLTPAKTAKLNRLEAKVQQSLPSGPFKGFVDDARQVTSFQYDPMSPCPSIGGNAFAHKNVLLSGAYDQVERAGHFLCTAPYLPLASRRDVCVFRTPPLETDMEITGQPIAVLYVSSSAIDTDFTVKVVDEYPPSKDYPSGFAMNITHGIQRCRYRDSRTEATFMVPGNVYKITITMYPTANVFVKGHRLRLDVSSSCYPHFDLNMNTGSHPQDQRYTVAHNSVHHNAAYPSHLILPIMGKRRVKVKKNKESQIQLTFPEPLEEIPMEPGSTTSMKRTPSTASIKATSPNTKSPSPSAKV